VSKFGLAVIVVAVVGGALWVEHGHRIDIEAPAPADFASLASEASGQRGNSMVRAHSALEDARRRADDTRPEPSSSARAELARAAACPDNDTMPYSASCIAFLEGEPATSLGRK
jgi:hypothetical protein